MNSAQRPPDEAANFITHGLGLLLSVIATSYLMTVVIAQHQPRTIMACAVYCLTLVLLYSASTLSHAFRDLERRRLFRTLDQACIFLLIAGSFTPFAAIFLDRAWWWLLLAIMWILALAGVLFVLRQRDLTGLAKIPYLVMGWLPVVALRELSQQAPFNMLVWIVVGGACYSLGTIFLALDGRVRYFHAVWHTLVIAGSVCHFIGVVVYVVPSTNFG